MKKLTRTVAAWFGIVVITRQLVYSTVDVHDNVTVTSCPLWTRRQNRSCVCGDELGGVVECKSDAKSGLQVSILMYHCMTYNKDLDMTFVGHCSSVNYYSGEGSASNYYSLTHNYWRVVNVSKDLNNVMCRYDKRCLNESFTECDHRNLQRTGQMCGSCGPSYAPPVYSYNPACVRCDQDYAYKYNWLKYIAIAFLPLTVFYIIVVLFRITVTSGAMNGYVLVSQIIASPIIERIINRTTDKPSLVTQVGTSIYGVWNLDFFRDVYKPFCLSPKLTTLQTLTLDYLVAVYPILLIIITYFLVKLHDDYRVFRYMWRPFNWCFSHIRKEWEIRSSLVAMFVTFLLLSYVKILNVSFYLLIPNTLYDVNGNTWRTSALYYDGTYEYFGKRHLPYAFLALFMLFVFNIIPLLLLCLYPFRCFHKCLNCLRIRTPALHIFMDTFHASYKLEPRDCRWFAALFLMLRVINQILVAITLGTLYFPLAGILFLIALLAVAIFRPYKLNSHSVIDFVLLATLCVLFFGVPGLRIVELYQPNGTKYFIGIITLALVIPPFYIIGLLVYKIIPKRCCLQVKESVQQRFRQKIQDEESSESEPYRLQHSDEYAPLLVNREQNQQ